MFLLSFIIIITKSLANNAEKSNNTFLTPSLFSNVPPYLKFSVNHSQYIPSEISKHLIWGSTNYFDRNVLKRIMSKTGIVHFLKSKESKDSPSASHPWFGRWDKYSCTTGRQAHIKRPIITQDYQKYNHFPGATSVSYKDKQWVNLQNLIIQHGSSTDLDFLMPTFILPREFEAFKNEWERLDNKLWMGKLPMGSGSRGVKFITHWNQYNDTSSNPVVVQKYLENPFLLDGKKCELLMIVVLTSVHPLRIYTFDAPLLKINYVNFTANPEHLNDSCIHFPTNKNNVCGPFQPNLSLANSERIFFDRIRKTRGNSVVAELKTKIENVIILTFFSAEKFLVESTHSKLYNRYNAFQLFSFDFLFDTDLNPFLLETNSKPLINYPIKRIEDGDIKTMEALNLAGM